MAGYFNFFPTISYANGLATNVITKIRFNESVQENLAIFYPYTIKQGERADQIAARVYDDAKLDWIIYLSNNIMDPYYDWPLSQEQFNQYIKEKYGSVVKAEQISFYRNNYQYDDSLLSPTTYDSLSSTLKKYYSPLLGYNENIISYKRKELDTVLETNFVVNLKVDSTTGFSIGEKITQSTNSGYVTQITTDSLIINKVTGTFSNDLVVGVNSNSTANVTGYSILNQSIPSNEIPFYSPVTYLQYEEELNNSKFNIRILDKSYVGKIIRDVRELFK